MSEKLVARNLSIPLHILPVDVLGQFAIGTGGDSWYEARSGRFSSRHRRRVSCGFWDIIGWGAERLEVGPVSRLERVPLAELRCREANDPSYWL
jgi:hypothetical protein